MPSYMAPPRVALPTASCRTTCCSAALLLLEIASAPTLFVLAHRSSVYSGALYASATLSLLAILCGVLGMMRATPALVASLMIAVSTTFAFVLLGGLSVIFRFNIDTPMAVYLDQTLVPVTAAEKTKLVHDAKLCLSVAAAVLLTSAGVHALYARHMYAVVGERRGAAAFLQIFAIVTLPFALYLVVGGQYIVDTGTLATAPYTGIIVFAVGTAMLVVALLAFVGGTFEYRRLLSICCLLSFVSGTCVVGVAIAYVALRTRIHENLLAHWTTIRDVLPPTYQARYSREQFGAFMTANLKMAAFVAAVIGLFLMLEAAVCLTLMHHATRVKRQLAQDKETVKQADGGAGRVDPHDQSQAQLRRQWTLHFELSKRRQRIAMRFAALVFVLGVAFIFSVLCANVVFAAKCSSIGKLVQSVAVPVVDSAVDAASVDTIRVTNKFTRGTVAVAPPAPNATAGLLELSVYGSEGSGRKASDFYTKRFAAGVLSVAVAPLDVTRFLWIDGSCQRSVLTLSVPSAPLPSLDIVSNATVVINTHAASASDGSADTSSSQTTGGETLRLRGVRVETAQPNIECAQVAVLEGGVALQSVSGQVAAHDFTVNGRMSAGVDTAVAIDSALGTVDIRNATLVQCDLQATSGAGAVFVADVESTAMTGRSRVLAQSVSGGVSATNVRANWIDLRSDHGDVFAQRVFTEGNAAFMGRLEATTVSGDITLEQVDASGSVHVESSSGAIRVQITSMSFIGMYYVRSERGSTTIRKAKYAGDALVASPSSAADTHEKRGAINCNVTDGSCLSHGELHLRAQYGDVELVFGCDTFQCN